MEDGSQNEMGPETEASAGGELEAGASDPADEAAAAEAEAAATEEGEPEAETSNDELEARIADADVVNAEAAGEAAGATASFTATTTSGEEVQIVRKEYEGQQQLLVTDTGARYVSRDDGDLEGYDPAKHTGNGSLVEEDDAA